MADADLCVEPLQANDGTRGEMRHRVFKLVRLYLGAENGLNGHRLEPSMPGARYIVAQACALKNGNSIMCEPRQVNPHTFQRGWLDPN